MVSSPFCHTKKKIQQPNNILQNMIFWICCLQYGSMKDWSRNGTYNTASTNKYTDKHSFVHKKHCKRKPNKLLRQRSSGEPVFYTFGDANIKGVKLASGNLRTMHHKPKETLIRNVHRFGLFCHHTNQHVQKIIQFCVIWKKSEF